MVTVPDSSDLIQPSKRGGRMSEHAAVEEVPVWLEVNGRPDRHLDVHARPAGGAGDRLAARRRLHRFHRPGAPPSLRHRPRILGPEFRKSGCSRCRARADVLCWHPAAAPSPLSWRTLPPSRRSRARGGRPRAGPVAVLFKALFAKGERYKDTGGIHAAALVDAASQELVAHAEDIGRHNAVDKSLGAALLARRPVAGHGTSGDRPDLRGAGIQGCPGGPGVRGHPVGALHPGGRDRPEERHDFGGPGGERSSPAPWSPLRVPPDRARLEELIGNARRIAVVGLSRKPDRPSHAVAAYLQRAGYTIIPVHPAGGVTLGEPVYPDLRSASGRGRSHRYREYFPPLGVYPGFAGAAARRQAPTGLDAGGHSPCRGCP